MSSIVSAAFDDAAFLQQQNHVGAPDGREAVGDDECRAAGQQGSHRRLNELLALRIQVARRLVQDQNLRRRENCSRDRQSLALTS